GIAVGAIVNLALISIGHAVIPLPAGADVSSFETLKSSMHLFGPEQFIFPFLAHAGGTLIGAFVAALIASSKQVCAFFVGFLFLLGGIANVFMLPAPLWYDVIDVVFAYFPMAWIATKLGVRKQGCHKGIGQQRRGKPLRTALRQSRCKLPLNADDL